MHFVQDPPAAMHADVEARNVSSVQPNKQHAKASGKGTKPKAAEIAASTASISRDLAGPTASSTKRAAHQNPIPAKAPLAKAAVREAPNRASAAEVGAPESTTLAEQPRKKGSKQQIKAAAKNIPAAVASKTPVKRAKGASVPDVVAPASASAKKRPASKEPSKPNDAQGSQDKRAKLMADAAPQLTGCPPSRTKAPKPSAAAVQKVEAPGKKRALPSVDEGTEPTPRQHAKVARRDAKAGAGACKDAVRRFVTFTFLCWRLCHPLPLSVEQILYFFCLRGICY